MHCDRCGQPVDRMDDLVFTAYANEGGHFCRPCIKILEPELEANFQRLKPLREAALAQMEKDDPL